MRTRRRHWDDRLWNVAWIILIAFAALSGWHLAYGELHFDSHVWKAENPGRNSKRKRMVNNLMCYVLKEGMTRKQVIEILGRDDNNLQTDHLDYDLGQITIFSWNRRFLELKFDKSKRLTDYQVQILID